MNPIIPYTAPTFRSTGFNCPFCHAYANQEWGQPNFVIGNVGYGSGKFWSCRCSRCQNISIWFSDRMVYPWVAPVPPANPDLPEDVKRDYDEAVSIVSLSPRGASAMLRLCIQNLCRHLGEKGENINDDIAAMVKKELPVKIQQALDIVRVVGNNAVHPGQIDLKDDLDTATKLFGLVNLIAEVMISQPKHVAVLYDSIVPESQRNAIKRRDTT